MSKGFALALVLVFLMASCVIVAKPVSGATGSENTWVEKEPMHQARSGLGVAVVNGKIYAIGGTTLSYISYTSLQDTGGIVGTNEEYDPAKDNWTYKASMPVPLVGFITAVCQNKIYCIDGNVNEVYDPATDMWENKSAITIPEGGQANVVDGKIYMISQSSTQVYDPVNDCWTTKAPMPIAQAGFVSAVVDNKIYVIGPTVRQFSSLTQIYDTEKDSWSQGLHPSPLNAYYTAAVATSGVMAPKRIYALGLVGEISVEVVTGGVDVYDPASDSWSHGAYMPTHRAGFGAAIINDLVYVIGGRVQTNSDIFGTNYTEYATNEQYTPFGYGTVPPVVSVDSPNNQNYSSTEISLNFTVNKPVNWAGYSLDGKENVTLNGNTTLAGLSNGLHNITVYANDTFGNIGASETIAFTIAKPEPFPTVPVAVVSMVIVAVACVGILLYLRKNRH
jgi:N-acetylneuraminic acid mutarotase